MLLSDFPGHCITLMFKPFFLIVLLTSAVNSSEINGITKQASGFGVFDDPFVLHVLRLPVVMVSAA